MKLKFPLERDREEWNKRNFYRIAYNGMIASPYYLIAIAEHGTDIYVVFTNETKDQVWIEKTSKLLGENGMYYKNFQQIKTDEEFNFAHQFFINQGILDGQKNSKLYL